MAMMQGKSGLAGTLNDAAKKAFETNKSKVEVPQDFGELPAGISGVAQLRRIGFKRIEEVKPGEKHGGKVGQYWFNAMGVVCDPVYHTDDRGNRVRVAGKQTRIIEAVFDTPPRPNASEFSRNTQAEHLDWIIKQIKYLMGDTLANFDVGDLETICEMLTKQKPYFSFSTSGGQPSPQYPKPRVFHNWHGRVDDFVPPQAEKPMVSDNSNMGNRPSTAQTNGAHVQPSAAQALMTTTPAAIAQRMRGEEMPPPEDTFDEFGDIDSLVEKANAGDQQAGAELTALAVKAGVPEEDVSNADSWDDVKGLILDQKEDAASFDGGSEGSEEEKEEPKPITPKIGVVYRYKGKLKKPVDVECVKVNTKQSKCVLKDMSSGKEYADVPFTDVLPPG